MASVFRSATIASLAAIGVGCTSPRATPPGAAQSPAPVAVVAADCGVQRADTAALWREADVERPVTPLRSIAPTYPGSRLPGSVLMAFVVDTLGRVEPCSMRVVRTSAPEFAAAVTAVLLQYQFHPAVRGGQKVRQFVELPFTFAVQP